MMGDITQVDAAAQAPPLSPAQCRAARALLRWSQARLAEQARVARATIRDFENGRHRLHRSTRFLIVAALGAAGVTLLGDPDLGLGVFLREDDGLDDDGPGA